MSVIRVGSTAKYADGWSHVFGKAKAPGSAKRAKATAKKGAKTASKKKAKKRGR